jgi:hypothetical protein
MKTVGQFRGFGNRHRPAVEIFGALIEDSFEHKGDRYATRGHRGSDTCSRGYRQFGQRINAAKPPPLRLIQELTLQMHRRQIDYRLGQRRSRKVSRDRDRIAAATGFPRLLQAIDEGYPLLMRHRRTPIRRASTSLRPRFGACEAHSLAGSVASCCTLAGRNAFIAFEARPWRPAELNLNVSAETSRAKIHLPHGGSLTRIAAGRYC